MPVKKILTWTAVILIAYYLVTTPTGAGHAVGVWLSGIKRLGNFFSSL